MSHQSGWDFLESSLTGLVDQGYKEVAPPDCVDLVLFKQTMGGLVPSIVAVINIATATEPLAPSKVTYKCFKKWAKDLLGNNGVGRLVFVYEAPPIEVVEEILKLGRGILGYGQITPCVCDLSGHKFWLWQPMPGLYSTKKL